MHVYCAHRRINICGHEKDETLCEKYTSTTENELLLLGMHACLIKIIYTTFFLDYYFFLFHSNLHHTQHFYVLCGELHACHQREQNTFSCKTTTNNHKIVIFSLVYFHSNITIIFSVVFIFTLSSSSRYVHKYTH